MRRALLIVLALAACARPAAPDPRSLVTRAQLDGFGQAVLLAELPSLSLAGTMAVAGARDGVTTWQTADNTALSFRDGVLVATRGLGNDLMSADVSGTLAALSGGPKTGYSRAMTFVDGEDRTVFRAFTCEMAPPQRASVAGIGIAFPAVRHDETCYATGIRIDNSYWMGSDGRMRRAEQWVSPVIGLLSTELLTR
jgi:hypothetical protein